MTKTFGSNSAKLAFTEDERKAIGNAAADVWQAIGGDCLSAIVEEKGKNVDRVSMSRADVIELALDAGRMEDILKRRATPDLMARVAAADYATLIEVVKPAFPYTRYGM